MPVRHRLREATRGGTSGLVVVAATGGHPQTRIASVLRSEGIDCHEIDPGADVASVAVRDGAEAVLLDLDGLPDDAAYSVLGAVAGVVPTITMSSADTVEHTVAMLDAGADDHLVKPVAREELLARLHALVRRTRARVPPTLRIHVGAADIDFGARVLRVGETHVPLTATEWRVIETLARHPGEALDHERLAEEVWGHANAADSRSLRVHISNVRRKLAGVGVPLIDTDHGLGYRWRGPGLRGG